MSMLQDKARHQGDKLPNHTGAASTLGLPWKHHRGQECRKVWEGQGDYSCGGETWGRCFPNGHGKAMTSSAFWFRLPFVVTGA